MPFSGPNHYSGPPPQVSWPAAGVRQFRNRLYPSVWMRPVHRADAFADAHARDDADTCVFVWMDCSCVGGESCEIPFHSRRASQQFHDALLAVCVVCSTVPTCSTLPAQHTRAQGWLARSSHRCCWHALSRGWRVRVRVWDFNWFALSGLLYFSLKYYFEYKI